MLPLLLFLHGFLSVVLSYGLPFNIRSFTFLLRFSLSLFLWASESPFASVCNVVSSRLCSSNGHGRQCYERYEIVERPISFSPTPAQAQPHSLSLSPHFAEVLPLCTLSAPNHFLPNPVARTSGLPTRFSLSVSPTRGAARPRTHTFGPKLHNSEVSVEDLR